MLAHQRERVAALGGPRNIPRLRMTAGHCTALLMRAPGRSRSAVFPGSCTALGWPRGPGVGRVVGPELNAEHLDHVAPVFQGQRDQGAGKRRPFGKDARLRCPPTTMLPSRFSQTPTPQDKTGIQDLYALTPSD